MTQENEQGQEPEVQTEETVEELIFGKEDDSDPTEEGASIDEVHTIAGSNDEEVEGEQPTVEPEQVTDETVAEETAQDKLKFVQTSYQKHLELLKQADPAMFNQIQAQVKAERSGTVDAQTDEYADDPYGQQIAKGFADLKREQTAQINAEKYVQEYDTANNALEGFVKENSVSQDDLDMVFNKATAMGFDMNMANKNFQIGVPNRAVSYIMETLQAKLLADYYSGKATTIENETLAKAEQVNNVAQPNAGATPEPRKLTRDEKLLQVMNNAGKKDAIGKIFNS